MQQERWTGSVLDILDTARDAGLDGVELTMAVLSRWPGSAEDLRAALAARGLALACLRYTISTGFTDPADADAELLGAERAIQFASEVGTKQLGLKGASHPDPTAKRSAHLAQACRMYDEIGRRAADAGLAINVHLHSHPDSAVRTPDEWTWLLARTNPERVFVCADTGHLLQCGHDPVDTIRRHAARINHVHLKDATRDGAFPPLGRGGVDIPAVLDALARCRYDGWVVLEEEDDSQVHDPALAFRAAASVVRGAGW